MPEEIRIFDDAVFDDFGETGHQLPARQGAQHADVDENEFRLVKSADKIFAVLMVDGGLAADARVHLGQQSRRYLDIRNAAQISCRGKSRKITDHAPAQGEDSRFALKALPYQSIINRR